jgi:hypothetical protein
MLAEQHRRGNMRPYKTPDIQAELTTGEEDEGKDE